jgi:hypothetical protein
MSIYTDLKKYGYIEIVDGIYLQAREYLLSEQKEWDESDKSKNFDFTPGEYWITTNTGTKPQGFDCFLKAIASLI